MKKGIGILAASNKHGLSLTVESGEIYGKHASKEAKQCQTWGCTSTQDMEGFKHQTQLMLSTHLKNIDCWHSFGIIPSLPGKKKIMDSTKPPTKKKTWYMLYDLTD